MARPDAHPAVNELEVAVFGPGYGESIAIHVGNGDWVLVDSCLHPQSKKPASLEYLESIGVSFSSVKSIIASHWHDDHVRGLSALVRACPHAELVISDVFNDNESMAFLAAYGGPDFRLTAGTKELYSAVSEAENVFFAKQRCILYENDNARITAFSPTEAALIHAKLHIIQQVPKADAPINVASDLKPNIESVVVHVQVGDEAILLGSDLEDHGVLGWQGIVSNHWCIKQVKASAYKVAHHGSITGEHDEIWTHLLVTNPVSVLTPFVKGSVSLPMDQDRNRIKTKSAEAYISSGASRRPNMPTQIQKRLLDIAKKVTPLNNGFGSIHLRKKIGSSSPWQVSLDGAAQSL